MGGDGDSSKAAEAPAGDAVITINIRASNGSKFSVQTTIESTVAAFKAALVEKCEVPVEQQRLIYKGRILKDDRTLESYGLEADHTVHLVRGSAPQPASANTGSAAGTGGTNIPNTPGFTRGPGITEGGGVGAPFGDSLFPGLGINGLNGSGVPSLFGGGFSDIEQVQQQLTQNPNIMREFMNLPAVQNLMNNPDLMRQLIMSNPQMRDLIDRNPDIAHILNDPSTLRQTIEAARNPELMREMMRNTDRAMSNIESSPEGFNMLRRMYETVQEPFLNATTMAGNPGTDVASNPFAALLGNQGQTGDRSINSSNTGSETATGTPAPNTNPLPNPWNSTAATAGGQPTNTRSAPAGDARLPSIGSLGGQGVPDMGRMFGSMQDPAFVSQFLQNPAVQQVMDSMLSNPEYMNQVLSLNPQMRAMMDANPQMREMMQNPELIRQLTSPEALQHMASLQTLLSRNRPNQEQNQTGGVTGNNGGLDLLMNMFGGLGTGGLGTPNPLNVPPEQLYANQLSQLQEMGFFDTQENIRALSATAGNVSAAVERLLGNPGL